MLGHELFAYKGYKIPAHLVYLTGGGPETFDEISRHHISILREDVGIDPEHNFLEIGCGIGRDAIPLSEILTAGTYHGVDIIRPSIEWCRENISPKHPNFSFHLFDIKDQLHNPNGTDTTRSVKLPVADKSIDRIILWSVFTHMFRYDIVHYLDEFKRVMRPGARAYITCFIADEQSFEATRRINHTIYNLRFEHEYGPGCFVNDLIAPAGAVAYTEDALKEMVRAAGLSFAAPFTRGNWSGLRKTDRGQDAMILSLPEGA